MPHTYLTIQALLHFIYTSSLPAPSSPLCTPQILCSLLQIARPYRVDGLLESVVERLHSLLDSRNAAAVFNATAMAAGGEKTLRDLRVTRNKPGSYHMLHEEVIRFGRMHGLRRCYAILAETLESGLKGSRSRLLTQYLLPQ